MRAGYAQRVEHYLCVTCGTQYPASDEPPATCPICEDPRQYVPFDGQPSLVDPNAGYVATANQAVTG